MRARRALFVVQMRALPDLCQRRRHKNNGPAKTRSGTGEAEERRSAAAALRGRSKDRLTSTHGDCSAAKSGSLALPLVSLLVSTCNRPAFVAAALQAAASQDYAGRIEAIVVDDSTTTSTAVAVEAAQPSGRCSSADGEAHSPAAGLNSIGAKRNMALSHASGAIFMHWDDDDTRRARFGCSHVNREQS